MGEVKCVRGKARFNPKQKRLEPRITGAKIATLRKYFHTCLSTTAVSAVEMPAHNRIGTEQRAFPRKAMFAFEPFSNFEASSILQSEQ